MTPDWRTQAACLGLDPEIMIPARGESDADAKAVCADCAVREPCLADAVATRATGVRGGLSERQRRRMRTRRPYVPAACGTRAGYQRHRDHHEAPCDACRAANTAYNRGRPRVEAAS